MKEKNTEQYREERAEQLKQAQTRLRQLLNTLSLPELGAAERRSIHEQIGQLHIEIPYLSLNLDGTETFDYRLFIHTLLRLCQVTIRDLHARLSRESGTDRQNIEIQLQHAKERAKHLIVNALAATGDEENIFTIMEQALSYVLFDEFSVERRYGLKQGMRRAAEKLRHKKQAPPKRRSQGADAVLEIIDLTTMRIKQKTEE